MFPNSKALCSPIFQAILAIFDHPDEDRFDCDYVHVNM